MSYAQFVADELASFGVTDPQVVELSDWTAVVQTGGEFPDSYRVYGSGCMRVEQGSWIHLPSLRRSLAEFAATENEGTPPPRGLMAGFLNRGPWGRETAVLNSLSVLGLCEAIGVRASVIDLDVPDQQLARIAAALSHADQVLVERPTTALLGAALTAAVDQLGAANVWVFDPSLSAIKRSTQEMLTSSRW